MKFRSIASDPLFHFMVFGLLLFVFTELFLNTNAVDVGDNTIVVSKDRQAQLAALFEASRGRAPSADEMTGLIDNYVTEEAYYREALKLDLDKNDVVIRRRLQQKLEFLQEDVSVTAVPSKEVLQDWYKDNQEKFVRASRYSFKQVLLKPSDFNQISALIEQLNSAEIAPEKINQSVLLEMNNTALTAAEISGRFGEGFASSVVNLESSGVWSGPIESAFGLHVVLMADRIVPPAPEFSEVEDKVLVEYRGLQQQQLKAELKRQLTERYLVEIK